MKEPPQPSTPPSSFQVSISSLTLGSLYEAVLAFSSEDRLETLWPAVCQNARWLIPSRRVAILLNGPGESFKVVGRFEQGQFHKLTDTSLKPASQRLKRALEQKSAQWIDRPSEQLKEEVGEFAQSLFQDHPDVLFVLPMRMKGKTIGALLFVMASVADTDRAMLKTLGTIYALHAGMTYTLLQITEERRQMQSQLVIQEKMAALGSLVAGITHEINSPVGVIQSATDVLRRCTKRVEKLLADVEAPAGLPEGPRGLKECDAVKENTEIIAQAGGRISKIIQSLKSFARLDEAEYQRTNIHEGIDNALTLLQSELKDRITVIREYDELPEIYCYPGQLNQVFMSLLKNAGEAIEGAGTIRIETARVGEGVRIQISDSGRGIDPEKLERVFDLDFSKKGPRVKMRSGLATAYTVIQRHQGEIKAESKPGEGSTFTLTLPIQPN